MLSIYRLVYLVFGFQCLVHCSIYINVSVHLLIHGSPSWCCVVVLCCVVRCVFCIIFVCYVYVVLSHMNIYIYIHSVICSVRVCLFSSVYVFVCLLIVIFIYSFSHRFLLLHVLVYLMDEGGGTCLSGGRLRLGEAEGLPVGPGGGEGGGGGLWLRAAVRIGGARDLWKCCPAVQTLRQNERIGGGERQNKEGVCFKRVCRAPFAQDSWTRKWDAKGRQGANWMERGYS